MDPILLIQIGNLMGRRFARRSDLDGSELLAGILIQILFRRPLQKVPGSGPVPWSIYALAFRVSCCIKAR